MIIRDKTFTIYTFETQRYIFRKVIFKVQFLIIAFVLLLYAFQAGGPLKKNLYYSCPLDAPGGKCQNPFYEACYLNAQYSCVDPKYLPDEYSYLKNVEFVNAGLTLGQNPNALFSRFALFFSCLLAFGFAVNHYFYNRGFNFRLAFKVFRERLNESKGV